MTRGLTLSEMAYAGLAGLIIGLSLSAYWLTLSKLARRRLDRIVASGKIDRSAATFGLTPSDLEYRWWKGTSGYASFGKDAIVVVDNLGQDSFHVMRADIAALTVRYSRVMEVTITNHDSYEHTIYVTGLVLHGDKSLRVNSDTTETLNQVDQLALTATSSRPQNATKQIVGVANFAKQELIQQLATALHQEGYEVQAA